MEHTVKGEGEHTKTVHVSATVSTPRTVHVTRTVHKRKKSSSRGVRRFTEIDRRVSKMARRVSRAVDNGVDSYMEHRDKSAETRKDGPLVDFVENVSYGASKTISEASPILHDIAEAWNTRRLRKQISRAARSFTYIPFFG